MRTNTALSFEGIHSSLQTLFGADLHAKRVLSLAGATLGVIQSASLAVAMIGQGLALARGRTTKHATKQVDRLLSNRGIDIDSLLHHWVPFVVGSRPSIVSGGGTARLDGASFRGLTWRKPPQAGRAAACWIGFPERSARPAVSSYCGDDAVVLAAVQNAARRLRRCPAGILDCRCARRPGLLQVGTTGWPP